LPLEEVAVRVDRKVLVDVDDNMALIAGNLQGILGQRFRPHLVPSYEFL
jgi:hypothetical protein